MFSLFSQGARFFRGPMEELQAVRPVAATRRLARVLLDTGLPGLPVLDAQDQPLGFVSRTNLLLALVADPPLDLWT